MITKDNLTEVLNLLTEKEINETMNSNTNYIGLWLSSYGKVNLQPVSMYDDEMINDIESTGGLVCDKDDFLRLFKKSKSINPFLIAFL